MELSNHIYVSAEKIEKMCSPPPCGLEKIDWKPFSDKMDQIIQDEIIMEYYLWKIPCKM